MINDSSGAVLLGAVQRKKDTGLPTCSVIGNNAGARTTEPADEPPFVDTMLDSAVYGAPDCIVIRGGALLILSRSMFLRHS